MSDIRFNGWLHRSGSGGVYQDSSGRVGIGTSTQNHSLVLYQADSGTHDCISMRNSSTVNNGFNLGVSSTEDAFIWNGSNTNMTFATNNSEKLRITSAGRVGINETSPDRDLHISNTTPYIRVESTSANQPATLELHHTRANGSDKWPASVSTADAALLLNVAGAANGTPAEKVRIDSSGNFGIGTTPEEILHIKGPSEAVNARDGVLLQHSTDSDAADTGLPLVWSGRISSGLANYGLASICGRKENSTGGDGASYLQFATCNAAGSLAEKLRIESTGQMGLGTNSPSSWNADADDFVINSSGNAGITISTGSAGSTQEGNIFFSEGTAGSGDKFRGGIRYEHGADKLRFYTDTVQRLEVGEHTTVKDGNLVIGTAGHGIDFSATSDGGTTTSELLDDYEEGTFTGTWTGYTTAATTTATSANRYTKIGNQVTCYINLSNATIAGGAGAIKMEGLPYATSSSSDAGQHASTILTYKVDFDTARNQTFYTWQSVSFILGYQSRTGTTWTTWDIDDFHDGNRYCQFTFTYQAAT